MLLEMSCDSLMLVEKLVLTRWTSLAVVVQYDGVSTYIHKTKSPAVTSQRVIAMVVDMLHM